MGGVEVGLMEGRGNSRAAGRRDVWDDALVAECVAGEDAAWRTFHRHHQPIVTAFLRKLGVREPDLEDACQEVFLRAHRYLPGYRAEAEVKTWLYRLCATEARRARRYRRLAGLMRVVFHQHRSDDVVPAATRTDAALLRLVHRALDAMSGGQRLVFVLFELEGVPGRQVAEIAGCPEATLWRRLHEARAVFRRVLDPDSVASRGAATVVTAASQPLPGQRPG